MNIDVIEVNTLQPCVLIFVASFMPIWLLQFGHFITGLLV